MRHTLARHVTLPALLACLLAACASPGHADDDRRTARVPLLPAYQQECASCHLAFPPGMLPAASWRRLMDRLPHHFGIDASLDAPTRQQINSWLAANAGTHEKVARDPSPPPQDRITRAAWFVQEHDGVRPATWALPAVKSAANCAACHTRADQGEFRERDIRIPR
jgi:hypothetical protein